LLAAGPETFLLVLRQEQQVNDKNKNKNKKFSLFLFFVKNNKSQ